MRMAAADRLNEFIRNSRPQTPEIQRLDDLAGMSADALMKQTINLVASLEGLLTRIQEVRNAIESGGAPKSASPRGFKTPRVQKVSTRKGEKRKQA